MEEVLSGGVLEALVDGRSVTSCYTVYYRAGQDSSSSLSYRQCRAAQWLPELGCGYIC